MQESRCLDNTAAAPTGIVEARFVETVMGKKNTRAAMAMARAVRAAFEKRLRTVSFLDAATRAEALVKVQQMEISSFLDAPDAYADVQVSATSLLTNQVLLTRRMALRQLARVDKRPGPRMAQAGYFPFVNAFYDPWQNRFTVLPGVAHGMFFGGAAAAKAYNFGSLGEVIGHEITHGFDDFGRHFDANGADRDWWIPTATAAFEQRAQCFVTQYEGFELQGVTDPETGKPAHVDGTFTLGENIADNGGIRAAYAAAEPYFPSGKSALGFTPQQQFFLASAQGWCEKIGAEKSLELLQWDPHSPTKARVNVSFSNFDRFAAAFSCKPNDAMVAKPACQIW